MIRDRLSRLTDKAKAQEARKRIAEAMELATQEADPVRPHRPLPSELPAARKMLNEVLLDLMKATSER
jgi:hypothetical protein